MTNEPGTKLESDYENMQESFQNLSLLTPPSEARRGYTKS